MEDNNKVIKADNWLEAVLAGGGDMIAPMDDPCIDCYGISCFGCPFDDSVIVNKKGANHA